MTDTTNLTDAEAEALMERVRAIVFDDNLDAEAACLALRRLLPQVPEVTP